MLSTTSEEPIYQQIYDQVCSQIVQGTLRSGECLPPIRTVARELEISVITVKRAWEELERAGFLRTVAGKGCFVAPMQTVSLADKRNALADEQLKKDLPYYRGLGLTAEELLERIRKLY